MKTTLTEFIEYLEGLASHNTDIKHNRDSHPAFIRFYEAENEKATARNQIKNLPCVLIKDYDFSFIDNKADNLHKVREIEFMILDKITRETKDVYEVWERTEEIGDEFIVRMKDDKRNGRSNVVNGFDLDNVKGVPVDVGIGGLYGTSYTIRINSIRANDPEPSKWNDL
ncbi:hypothetical protein ACT29H_09415 [Thermophagus sp. OGC60D27]|uniref:hypothetical protein n=1 Tax=Thermophagus sp. OGC60D27 TaxID=3458415 RepID=UPI0040381C69